MNPVISADETVMTLRSQLEEAYDRENLPAVQELSKQIDGLQLLRWAGQFCKAS